MVCVIGITACFLFSAVFLCSHLFVASQKKIWKDEIIGLQEIVRGASYKDILLHGAGKYGLGRQASPAPLDYIFVKKIDQLKTSVNYFSFPPRVYFRLWPILVTLSAVWFIIICFMRNICKNYIDNYKSVYAIQVFLLICACFLFLYDGYVYYYAIEMRPYALWNSLWFITGSLSLLMPYSSRLLIFFLTGLALSATGSIFQIISLACAYNIVAAIENKKLSLILKDNIKIFLFPSLISIYYCLRATNWHYADPMWGTWQEFFEFWYANIKDSILLIGSLLLCFINKENRRYAVLPVTMLILFLLGPAIYWITRSKGMFFSHRHYMYYGLTDSMALLICIQCMPNIIKDVSTRKILYIALAATFVIAGRVALGDKEIIARFHKSIPHVKIVLKRGIPYIEDEAEKKYQ